MTLRQRTLFSGAVPALILGAIAQSGVAAEVPGSAAEPLQQGLVLLTTPAPVATLPADEPQRQVAAAAPDRAAVECVAKVIVHEAGNQPRRGQVAVAQVIRTRLKAGRFGGDACAVVGQRGQFFDVATYHPARDDERWSNAVAIATSTLAGEGEEVAPGALFFHAAWSPMANRTRVAQIADHVFYR